MHLPQKTATLLARRRQLEAEIRRINAALADNENWVPLKAASRGSFAYETVRKWAEEGVVESRKEGGRVFVNQRSLDAYLDVRCAPHSDPKADVT